MITRQNVVDEALTWLGTPFHHEARVKGIGADCVGVVLGIAVNVGIRVMDREHYPAYPIHGIFCEAVDSQTNAVDLIDVLPGDLMKFKWGRDPQHLAIIVSVNPVKIVHAYAQVGCCILSGFDVLWQARFTDARRFREFA